MNVKQNRACLIGLLSLGVGCSSQNQPPPRAPVNEQPVTQLQVGAPVDAGVELTREQLMLALLRKAFPKVTTFENVTEWTIQADELVVVGTTREDQNSDAAGFWVRAQPDGSVAAQGSFGLAYPRAVRVLDLDNDGRPELVQLGREFVGESPGERPAVAVFSWPAGEQEPVNQVRASVALSGELHAMLETVYPQGGPDPTLPVSFPDDDALRRMAASAERYVPPSQTVSSEVFLLGLQQANPTEIRDAIGPQGLKLCELHEERPAHPRTCQTLTRRQLTDAVITSRVTPVLGNIPKASRGGAPLTGVLYADLWCDPSEPGAVVRCRAYSQSTNVVFSVSPANGNHLVEVEMTRNLD